MSPAPDEAAVQAVDPENLRQGVDSARLLDEPETQHRAIRLLEVLERRLGEAVARRPARARRPADPPRRVPGGADEPLGVARTVAVGQDEPLDAGVEVAEDERGLPVRDPQERRRPGALGSPGQVTDPLRIDAGVLAVGDQEVEAREGAELEELRRPELLEQRPHARLAAGELLAESVRSRHRSRAYPDRRARRSRTV
jgi:hypothetical protein